MTALTARQREIITTAERVSDPVAAAVALGISRKGYVGQLSYIRKKLRTGHWLGSDGPTTHDIKQRIRNEVAAGKRCARCWLLNPCDHDGALAGDAESTVVVRERVVAR